MQEDYQDNIKERTERIPPQNLDAEKSLLSAILISEESLPDITEIVSPKDFYDERNRHIYNAMWTLYEKHQPVDLLTVTDELKRHKLTAKAGGAAYLSELSSYAPTAAHARAYAELIANCAIRRRLITAASDITESAYDEATETQEILGSAEKSLFEVSEQNTHGEMAAMADLLTTTYDRLEDLYENKGTLAGYKTGFVDLDRITAGLHKSDLVILAARPAMGKTAFVLSMAKNMAVDFNIPVAIFSLEMSNVQLVNRLIMNVCEVEGSKIRNGRLSKAEWEKLENNISVLQNAPIYVDDTPGLSVFELRSKARKLVKDKKIQIIIIDYLQLMNANGTNFGSREQEVSIISRTLKGLAKELDIPVIALSQLSRAVEKRDSSNSNVDGKKPLLSDLRESGAIEQDADMVCFIHRPEYYKLYDDGNGKDLRGLGQIIVAKHRNGATDEIWLRFIGKYTRFQNENDAFEDDLYANVTYATQSSKMNMLPQEAEGAKLDDDIAPF